MSEPEPRPEGQPPGRPEPYADTGGWPPPTADQPRYGPGRQPDPTADRPRYGPGPTADQAQHGPYQPRYGPAWQPGDAAYGRLTGPPQQPTGRPSPAARQPQQPTGRPSPAARRRSATAGIPLTVALIAVNVVVFLFQQADPALTPRYGLNPASVEAGQYERLLTATFLHAGLLHIASNMLALFIVGAPLERAIGSVRYGVVYLTSALGGSLLALALSPPDSLGVGASGAIFGLFGAVAVLHRRVGADFRGIGMLIGLNLVISFAIPGISWQAHVGGLATGVVVGALLGWRPRRRPG